MRAAVLAGLCTLAGAASSQQPVNLGFEMPGVTGTDRPWGWEPHWGWWAGSSTMDSSIVRGGWYSFRLDVPEPKDASGPAPIHAMMMRLPADALQGKRVEMIAHVRSGTRKDGYAIHLQAWGPGGGSDSVIVAAPAGSEWNEHRIAVDVGMDVHSLAIILVVNGPASVWFDDLGLTADGVQIVELPSGSPPTSADLEVLRQHSSMIDLFGEQRDGSWPEGYDVIGRIIRGADIVSLGESTHGTSEFFTAKHRLVQYLVEVHDFRVFAIEANQQATERINAYVKGAPDTVAQAMGGLFGVWYREEVRDLIEWMRAHNHENPGRMVEFVGFDMQDPRQPMDSVIAFVRRADAALAERITGLYADHYSAWQARDYPQPGEGAALRWHRNAEEAWQLVSEHVATTSGPGDPAAQWAVQNASVARQCSMQATDPWNIVVRDSCMSVNIAWILTQRPPGTRMAVWAHDSHICRTGFMSGTSMGAHMDRLFGDRLRIIGISTYDGSYSATRSFSDHRSMVAKCYPAPVGSLEEAMHRMLSGRAEALVLDMRGAAADTRSHWLHDPRPVRSIGYSAFDFGFEQATVLTGQFDAVLLIDHTTPSRKLNR